MTDPRNNTSFRRLAGFLVGLALPVLVLHCPGIAAVVVVATAIADAHLTPRIDPVPVARTLA